MAAEMSGVPSHQAAAVPTQADPAAFADAISTGRTAINVHTPNQGSIAGTDLTIPFDQLDSRSAKLPQDRTTALAIYCMTGT